MKRIEALNNKIKFSAFGKTRKSNSRKATLKRKNCSKCGRLEDRPGPAQRMENQQRSQAPMSSQQEGNVSEQVHILVQKCSRLEGTIQPAQGMADQSDQDSRLEGDSRSALGMAGQVDQNSRLGGLSQPAQGMAGQGHQDSRLEGDSRPAQGMAGKGHQDSRLEGASRPAGRQGSGITYPVQINRGKHGRVTVETIRSIGG